MHYQNLGFEIMIIAICADFPAITLSRNGCEIEISYLSTIKINFK